MKFGVMLPHFRHVASPQAVQMVARYAQDLGYDSVWVSDHIVVPESGLSRFGETWYEPLTVLAYTAAVTQTVRLGTSVIIIPYRNAIVLAKVLATIDVFSGGRVIFGAGAGWSEDEFAALGVDFHRRGRLTDEALRAMRHVWTKDSPDYESDLRRIANVRFLPKPLQHPHIPIWIGGSSAAALRRAAEFGAGWHPTRPTPEAVAEGLVRLRQLAERRARDISSMTIAARLALKITDRDLPDEERHPLIGSADQITADIERYRQAGVNYFVLDTFYSTPQVEMHTLDDVTRIIERFAREVVPRVSA